MARFFFCVGYLSKMFLAPFTHLCQECNNTRCAFKDFVLSKFSVQFATMTTCNGTICFVAYDHLAPWILLTLEE